FVYFRNGKITIWIESGDKKAEIYAKTACCDTNSTLDGSKHIVFLLFIYLFICITVANELSLYAGNKSLPLITAFFKSFNVQNVNDNNYVRKKV
ncbi:unnamed protein product, partial [Brugia pahangi]|uniref:Ovule protein n=1 Tax=Brugia pahangi TaxID=6280 RepID=A0A0N4TZZ6_BRUPA